MMGAMAEPERKIVTMIPSSGLSAHSKDEEGGTWHDPIVGFAAYDDGSVLPLLLGQADGIVDDWDEHMAQVAEAHIDELGKACTQNWGEPIPGVGLRHDRPGLAKLASTEWRIAAGRAATMIDVEPREAGRWCEVCQQHGGHHTDRHPASAE